MRFVIPIIAIIIVLSFFYGVSVGHYEIFPFKILQDVKNFSNENTSSNISNLEISTTDISELIDIQNIDDIKLKKSNLIQYLWQSDSLPTSIPNTVKNVSLNEYDNYLENPNLDRIETFQIIMDYGVNSNPHIFFPQVSNGELIIYHRGHDGSFWLGSNTISYFVNEGYTVLAFSMPLIGENNQPIVNLEKFGEIKLQYHNDFELLESRTFSPVKFFIEPIIISLNYLEKNYNFDYYHMIGISGGGWTTTLSAAIDDRISKSYSVAGTSPFFMRNGLNDLGDYEQRVSSLYQISNYPELYVLASFGQDRKHYQIFNKFDSCCFDGESRLILNDPINQKLFNFSNNFEVLIDDTHKEHKISDYMHEKILNSLKNII